MCEFPESLHLVRNEQADCFELDLDFDPMSSEKDSQEYVSQKKLRECQALIGELKNYITETCLKDEKLRSNAIRILRLSSSEAAKRGRF